MKKLQTIYAVMNQLIGEDAKIDICYTNRNMAVEYIEKLIRECGEMWGVIYEYDGCNCWEEHDHKFWIEETTLE